MADRPHKTPVEKEIRKAVQSGNYAIDTTKEELRKDSLMREAKKLLIY